MSTINWKVRFRNKVWISAFVSQTLLLIQAIILGLEGMHAVDFDIEKINEGTKWVIGIVNAFLAYFSYLGIVQDPTVEGVGDSTRSLQREEPAPKDKTINL